MGQKCYEAFYYRAGLYSMGTLSFVSRPRFFSKHTHIHLLTQSLCSLRFRPRERRAQTFMTDKRKGNEARSEGGRRRKPFFTFFFFFSRMMLLMDAKASAIPSFLFKDLLFLLYSRINSSSDLNVLLLCTK